MKKDDYDLFRKIKYRLEYPVGKVAPRWAAMEMLQLKPHEFDRLRKEGHFEEFVYLGVIWFWTKDLYDWAYRNKPEVTNFMIKFNDDKAA